MPNCKSFLVTDVEKGACQGRARFQQNGDASCHHGVPPPPLQGKAPKEIHAIVTETIGEHVPFNAIVKNWVAQFKCGDFSTCDATRPGRIQNSDHPGNY